MPRTRNLVKETLVAYGAPLLGYRNPRVRMPLEEALASGLALSHREVTLFRLLPVVLGKNEKNVSLDDLSRHALALHEEQALGMLLELTGKLAGRPTFVRWAKSLKKPPPGQTRYFFVHGGKNRARRQLAEWNTPSTARRWGFLMNEAEGDFASALERFA